MLHQELFFPAGEVEIAHGNKDGEARGKEAEDVVHTVLVVAFAAGAFHQSVATKFEGLLGHACGDKLAGHRG